MVSRPLFIRLVILAMAAAGLSGGGPQDPPKAGDSEELSSVLRKLREARTSFYQRQRARAAEIDDARAPLRRLETEVAELKMREGEADRTLAELRADVERMNAEESRDTLRATLAPEIEKLFKEAREFIETGPPYRKDDRALRLGAAGNAPLSDQLGRYWSFLQEELRVARSGETYSADVPVGGGRVKPARIFRVGHLVLGYVTEDGEQSGLWDGQQWAAARSPGEDRVLRDAVDTLDRRRAPTLLPLPLLRKGAP